MPERPHIDNFRKQARALQRAVRAGDAEAVARVAGHHPGGVSAEFPLSGAQLVVAREYGFASWPRLVRYLDTVAEHGWDTKLGAAAVSDPADEFCRLACLTYGDDKPERWAQARAVLAEHPELTRGNIWAAAAAARVDDVRVLLAERPGLARERGGPMRWRPLFYLAYSRFDPDVAAADVLGVARLLLDAGGDPNEGYLFDALPSPFTVLTGVFGGGEQGQPAHPHCLPLAQLVLEAGASPNDAQALYNRMFDSDDSHLELLFAHGLGRDDGGPWWERVTELGTPADMLRVQLRWAVEHRQLGRVRLLASNGVDVSSPFAGRRPVWSPGDGRTPVEVAHLNGDVEIVSYLGSLGIAVPAVSPVDDLIAAVFRGDRSVLLAGAEVIAEARRERPGLIVWAAGRGVVEVVVLLVELGFDVNAYGRGDVPIEDAWETALHVSAGAGDVEMTRRLLELGGDPGLRDKRFGGTAVGWARHFGWAGVVALLEGW
ncbi:hypothetical protein [Actinokineospora inagensis]|uniref:hypothetical protein n=1 Tax=Actinokineospora inagensis TaxID=103730 RepID=UPI000551E57F